MMAQQTFSLSLCSAFFSLVELITKDISIEQFPSLSSTCQQLTTNYNFMCVHIHIPIVLSGSFFSVSWLSWLLLTYSLSHTTSWTSFPAFFCCCSLFFSSRVTCSQLFHIMVRCFVGWVILGAKFSICWFLRSFLKNIKSKAINFSPRAFLALKKIIHFDFMENSIIKMQKKISKNLNFKFLDLFRNFWTCKNVYYASSFSRRILKFIKLYKTNRNLLIP